MEALFLLTIMKPFVSIFLTFIYTIFSFISLLILMILPRKRVQNLYQKMDAREQETRIQLMKPFVNEGDTILDIGAGSGKFGKFVQEQLKVRVTGVDVCDYSDRQIPFFVYDGDRLPFGDKSFDVAFLAFVLHHNDNHEKLLSEALRVSKNTVMIFEDTYEWWWEKLFVCWNDYHTNVFQGWIKARKGYFKGDPSRMPMPLTFRSPSGWKAFFKQFDAQLVSETVRTMRYKPLKKVTFCLRPN